MYVCVLFSLLCLPLMGSCWRSCYYHKGDGPAPTRVGANVQRHKGVGSPPTGSAEAGGGRGATPRTSRRAGGNLSPINRLRTAAEYQSEGGRRAAGSISVHFRRVDHTLY